MPIERLLGSFLLITAASAGGSARAEPPMVVTTTPADGATLPAGQAEIAVTFSEAMEKNSYSLVTSADGTMPECQNPPQQSADAKTFSWKCSLQPGKKYSVWFNQARYQNFKSAKNRVSAQAHELSFSTEIRP